MFFSNKNKEDKEKKIKEKQKKKQDQLVINELIMNWQNTFGNLKHWNQEFNGYTLSHIKVHDYGCSARIYAPWGIDLYDLSKFISIIETGCKCEFIYEIPEQRQFALANFIYPEQVKINEWEFRPIKVKPWEFCPGYDITGKPVIFNLNNTPHILIAGQQRRGKNGSADHAIISWIYSCDETEITLYFFQCAKNDLIKYKNCKQVYCYADNLDDILIALEHIEDELKRRTELFQPMISKAEGNDNIFHYNKLHFNKLPYIIIVIDEFIELMPDNSVDDKELKEKKNKIMKYLRQIGQWGGSLGINYVILHQKPSKELMPTFIKNQSSIRICFGFEDLVCCAIVLGDELAKYAHKIPPRKAYFSNNEQNGYLYTPNLKGRIKMFIESSINPNHRTLFRDLEKINEVSQIEIKEIEPNEDNEIIPLKDKGVAPLPSKLNKVAIDDKSDNNTSKEKTVQINTPQISLDFSKVDPVQNNINNQKLIDNIKNIPNFVPYNPKEKSKIIIDQTKIDSLSTQKPLKKVKEVSNHVNSQNDFN